jgi:hypothetical protein
MGSHPSSSGTVTLMGSGEMTKSMSRVHRWVVSKIEEPVRAVFVDTPAGFELNADDISQGASEYVTRHVGVPCSVVSFRAADRVSARETRTALSKLERANYIFAGPGSPTYAVRNWQNTPLFDLIARRVAEGAHLVLASAAAITIGRYVLPVYEIFKVGEEPHWVDGLDLLASHGLELAIVTHWNNAEGGTYDTRYCFMGQPRFEVLEQLLPDSTVVLGIDEYTACVLDLGADECRVMGAGRVIIRRRGREVDFEAGTCFSLDQLRSETATQGEWPERSLAPDSTEEFAPRARETLLQRIGKAEEDLATTMREYPDLADVAGHVHDLAQAVDRARDAGLEADLISEARASLRQSLVDWSGRLAPSPGDAVESIAPFVELLISVRSQLRDAKQWALADEIRDGLAAIGIILEDDQRGTTWRRR